VSVVSVGRANAQISPGSKVVQLPPAPAPVLAGADQQPRTIWPLVRFDLPPNTVAIRVTRQQAGSTSPLLLTPTDVPIASVSKYPMSDHTYYVWPDNSLTALGSYSYSIAAVLDDGRVGTSTWLPFTPQVYEPTNVTVQKTSSYSATVFFGNSPLPARTYRLYGTGLVTYGVEATMDRMHPGGSVPVGNLPAGTYNWVLRAVFDPSIRSNGVPVSVTLP
jgi:hypothetical protein